MSSIAIKENTMSISGNNDLPAITIQFKKLKRAVMILRSINHGLRQDIIRLIEANGRMTVTEIYVQLRLEQSVASQQLSILRDARVLKTERQGKYIFYSIDKNRLRNIQLLIEDIVNY